VQREADKESEVISCIRSCGRSSGAGGSRGMCHTCYEAARVVVKRGETTWAELEAAGLALPVKPKRWGKFTFAKGK